jgi:hypothetical protein
MKNKVKITALLSLLTITLSIPVSVELFLKGYQFPRAQEAESPISFTPSSGTHRVGEPFIVKVDLNTRGQRVDALDLLINGVSLEVTGFQTSLPSSLNYIYGPENLLNRVLTSIIADPINGFSNTSNQTVLELSVKGLAYCAESRLTLDPQFSIVASQGENIIGTPEDAVFNIEAPPGVLNPEFTSPPTAEAQLNQAFYYRAEATNPNNTYLNFQYSNLPDWLVANGPEISGVPYQTGTFLVGIIVTDNEGGSDCMTLTITAVDQEELAISEVRADPVTFDSATISWRTNRPATSVVEYGKTTTYNKIVVNYDLDQNHTLTLHGLTPSTTYHYRVKSEDPYDQEIAVSSDHVFTTPHRVPEQPILKINLKMEGKRPMDNDHSVTITSRDQAWWTVITPHGDGYYPLPLDSFPFVDNKADILLKGYQHLQVRREVEFPPDTNEASVDFGLLLTGDIAPRSSPDNYVNTLDYSILISEMRPDVSEKESIADLNSDWVVNSIDYSFMINNFNKEGES